MQVLGMLHTWRAPSSPHLACGLNRSFFLRFCAVTQAKPAGGCLSVSKLWNTCGILRRGAFRNSHTYALVAKFGWCLGKEVRFFLSGLLIAGSRVFVGLVT